jgi:peptide-methionine (S)-S-oxide reductase
MNKSLDTCLCTGPRETIRVSEGILFGGHSHLPLGNRCICIQQKVMIIEKAILAGGCFWGVEELIRKLPGVKTTVVGYTGGEVPNATYHNHGNHAEGIAVEFDPGVLPYRKLLEFFFQIHDPTTRNRQGNDRGTSYRSAIFYLSDEQKQVAEELIREMTASGKWPGVIVTEVVPAGDFWNAEAEHQDYLQKNPGGYTCHFLRPEWTLTHQTTN